ncbi:MAG: Gfo/Idh/MocA family oxidoreductase [Clostridia bacterium]|nr:Gfo/Idh/MocA family oxidoreductase [Clostridia bacterium]
MDKKIRLGIIGIGNMGSSHATSIKEGKCPDFVLSAVADTDPAKLEWAKENLGEEVSLFDTAESMLDSGMIDACIVATPHYDHPTYVIACLEHGIHVMSEKPAGVYTKQVREMIEAADKHPDVVFGMMFNQRTNHIYRKVREIIKSGVYGNIRRTNWMITNWYRPQAYYDSGAWRATWSGEGGGVLMNQCPHQLDLWQWICGMPVKVQANMKFGQWHDIEVEDDVTAYVEYENGATGVFITTTGDACGNNRLEIQLDRARIVCTDGMIEVIEFEQSEPEFSRTNKSPFGGVPTHRIDVETDKQNTQHNGVLNAWGGAILRGEPLVADGREGLYGLMLSNAMHLSAWTGKTVDMPFDEELYYNELMKRVATSRRKPESDSVIANLDNTYSGTSLGEHHKRWDTNW